MQYAKDAKPSARGEIEITSIIQRYIDDMALSVEILGRGFTWLDTGTHENLVEAANFVHTIEKRQGLTIACIEEIAYIQNFIDFDQLKALSSSMGAKSSYSKYLERVVKMVECNQSPIYGHYMASDIAT